MNRHDRRKAKAMEKARPLTPELAEQHGLMIRNMQDAMGVVAALLKKMGGEMTIMADDLVRQYQISEERVAGGFTLRLHEITRAEYREITGEVPTEH
jgi:hypothetical protein